MFQIFKIETTSKVIPLYPVITHLEIYIYLIGIISRSSLKILHMKLFILM